MLASLGEAPLVDPHFVYEPKYDGIRVIADVRPGDGTRLWSRLGNEKTSQFPEIAAALDRWGRRLPARVVLDGELVALDAAGQPTGFQRLQGRIHLADGPATAPATSAAVALVVFDLLHAAGHDLRDHPLRERRRALEALLKPARAGSAGPLRLSEQAAGDGRALYERALASGWEGLVAKHAESRYRSGKRTSDWRKLKILHEQEFVIAGWTEPRQTRAHFGALLLGVYDEGTLVYVGHTGTGFDEQELDRVMALLRAREVARCPFGVAPKTNERAHWVRPELVAQVKFTEWTTDGRLRHPVYLGLRDDARATSVRREPTGRLHASARARLPGERDDRPSRPVAAHAGPAARGASARELPPPGELPPPRALPSPRERPSPRELLSPRALDALVRTLHELEDARRDATIDLGPAGTIAVTNLHKPFWPALKLTKGDLFRYYVQVAAALLPAIADRPLVMKRYPNGIAGKPFYQHRASHVPAGVRVEAVGGAGASEAGQPARPHIVGGDLLTLLYTTQLAAISQDPWFSRVGSLAEADHVAIDLDPSDDVPFRQVLDVARAVRDELRTLDAWSIPKTSGASGLHVYIPLPPGTPYEAGLLYCQLVATVVAHKHPRLATVERSVRARGRRVYVDYLQNSPGKTLASAYSARASAYAGVATPLTWDEVEDGVDREDFTIRTVPARLRRVGDLWAALRRAPGVDLARAARYGG